VQCGHCITGVIMQAKALLDQHPNASDDEIKQALASSLTRSSSVPMMGRSHFPEAWQVEGSYPSTACAISIASAGTRFR